MKSTHIIIFIIIPFLMASCDRSCIKTHEGDEENKILSRVDYYPDCSDTSNYLHKAFFPNGQLAHSFQVKENKRNGYYVEINSDGDTLRTGNYENGFRKGLWIITVTSDYLEKTYLKDTLHGATFERHSDGTEVIGQYFQGSEFGKWEWYFPDSTKEVGHYLDGELNGLFTSFYANGKKKWQAMYSNDTTFTERVFFDTSEVIVPIEIWLEKWKNVKTVANKTYKQ